MSLTSLQELGVALFRAGIVQTGEFTLKVHERLPEAPLSPIYINLRMPPKGTLSQELIDWIARELWACAQRRELTFTRVVGLPTAAEPLAEAFLRIAGLPETWFLRLEKGEAGGKRKIGEAVHGEVEAGRACLLIDDVVTAADTKMEAATALRAVELEVTDCLVVVDREQGGAADLARHGMRLHSLFTLNALLGLLQEEGEIDGAEVERVQAGIQGLNEYLAVHSL
jgi:uridine monophosphate synthetase